MLEVRDLKFRYNSSHQVVLHGLNLSMEPGGFLAAVGPSGSGKSTFLRALNGLIPHFYGGRLGGSVSIDGHDTRTESTADLSRHLGFVGQEPESQTVFDTVVDEVAFGPENLGLSTGEIQKNVESALQTLGIEHLRERDISTLSGGERQRVVIAATLSMGSQVLALDEPLSQLDPWAAREFLTSLHALNRDVGITVVIAEHRIDRLLSISSDVLEFPVHQTEGRTSATIDAIHRLRHKPSLIQLAEACQWPELPLTIDHARQLRIKHGPTLPPRVASTVPTGRAIASVRDLSVEMGDRLVLKDVSLELHEGSISAIVGANGSGKTTLLRSIAGLRRPSGGSVQVNGQEASAIPTRERSGVIGFVPQHPAAMFLGQTVGEEIGIALGRDNTSQEIDRILSEFRIDHLSERYSYDISGGERQRLALAIAMAGRPRLLVLDEPTRGMDEQAIRELDALLARLGAQGVSIVIATHDTDLVASCADHVVLLESGVIQMEGSPEVVLSRDAVLLPLIGAVVGNGYLTVQQVAAALREKHTANVRV